MNKLTILTQILYPNSSINLAKNYLLLGFSVLISGIVLALILQYEYQYSGLQILANGKVYQTLLKGHGLILGVYAIVPALFAGVGYLLLHRIFHSKKVHFKILPTFAFLNLLASLLITIGCISNEVIFIGGFSEANSLNEPPSKWPGILAAICYGSWLICTSIHFLFCLLMQRKNIENTTAGWLILATSITIPLTILTDIFFKIEMLPKYYFANLSPILTPGFTEISSILVGDFTLIFAVLFLAVIATCSTISKKAPRPIVYLCLFSALAILFYRSLLTLNIIVNCNPDELLKVAANNAENQFWLLLSFTVPITLLAISWFLSISSKSQQSNTKQYWIASFLLVTSTALIILSGNLPTRTGFLIDTTYVVSIFHMIAFISAVFAIFANWYEFFPNLTGRQYLPILSKLQALVLLMGSFLTFIPMLIMGLKEGVPRRILDMPHLSSSYSDIMMIGSCTILTSFIIFIANWVVAKKDTIKKI